MFSGYFLRILLFWGINLEMAGFLGSSPGGMKTARFSVAETPGIPCCSCAG